MNNQWTGTLYICSSTYNHFLIADLQWYIICLKSFSFKGTSSNMFIFSKKKKRIKKRFLKFVYWCQLTLLVASEKGIQKTPFVILFLHILCRKLHRFPPVSARYTRGKVTNLIFLNYFFKENYIWLASQDMFFTFEWFWLFSPSIKSILCYYLY